MEVVMIFFAFVSFKYLISLKISYLYILFSFYLYKRVDIVPFFSVTRGRPALDLYLFVDLVLTLK